MPYLSVLLTRTIGLNYHDGYISTLAFSSEHKLLFATYEYVFDMTTSLVIVALNETDFTVVSWYPVT